MTNLVFNGGIAVGLKPKRLLSAAVARFRLFGATFAWCNALESALHRFDQSNRKGRSGGDVLQHAGHLVVSLSNHVDTVQLFNVIANL